MVRWIECFSHPSEYAWRERVHHDLRGRPRDGASGARRSGSRDRGDPIVRGGHVGDDGLTFTAPMMAEFALRFGPAEYFCSPSSPSWRCMRTERFADPRIREPGVRLVPRPGGHRSAYRRGPTHLRYPPASGRHRCRHRHPRDCSPSAKSSTLRRRGPPSATRSRKSKRPSG